LDTKGADIAEAAEGVGGNQLGAGRQVGEVGVGGEVTECDVFVLWEEVSSL